MKVKLLLYFVFSRVCLAHATRKSANRLRNFVNTIINVTFISISWTLQNRFSRNQYAGVAEYEFFVQFLFFVFKAQRKWIVERRQ